MDTFYCRSWFRAKKQPIGVMDSEKARELHNARKQYTVLIDSIDKPSNFVEINDDFVGVSFLDEELREYLTYQFQEIDKNKLFLSMATHREFNDDGHIIRGTTYYFNTNGTIKIEKEDFEKEQLDVASSQSDIHNNWENYPVFGEYSKLCIQER